jgi:LysR family nitrogen assimilation transcriptional regulator
MSLDSEALRDFMRVAETGSVSAAARQLHITQPALSRRIKLLEEELGEALFERTGRGVRVTEAGALLEAQARPLLRQLDRLAERIVSRRTAIAGTVRCAVPPSFGPHFPADLVQNCQRLYPDVNLQVQVALSGGVHDGLADGSLDLGVLYQPVRDKRLEAIELVRERLWLVGPRGAKLSEDEPVLFRDALALPMVLPARKHGLRALVEGYAAREGRRLEVQAQVDGLSVLVELVRRGVGYSLLPRRTVSSELRARKVSIAPIRRPTLRRVTALTWSRERPRSPAIVAVAEEIRELGRAYTRK